MMACFRYIFIITCTLCPFISVKAQNAFKQDQDTIKLTPRLRWDSSLTSKTYTAFYIDPTGNEEISSIRKRKVFYGHKFYSYRTLPVRQPENYRLDALGHS